MEGKNNNIITTILVIVLIGAAFYIGKLTTEVKQVRNTGNDIGVLDDPSDQQIIKEVPQITEADHIRGNKNAKIALVEYSDIECPFCQSFHPTAKQAVDEYADSLMWVYRHFPLDQLHPDARPAAIATECVAKLNGDDTFWTYLDSLYDSGRLSEDALVEQATSIGVNESDLRTCLTDSAIADLVEEDFQSGIKAGVNGTPGNMIINLETGDVTVLAGAVPLSDIKEAVDAMLNK